MKNKYVKLIYSIIFWNLIGLLFVLLRSVGLPQMSNVAPVNLYKILPQLCLASLIFGFLFWIIDLNFEKFVSKNTSFLRMVLIKSIFYMSVLFIGSISYTILDWAISTPFLSLTTMFKVFFFKQTMNTFIVYLYFGIVFILYNFFQQLSKMFGSGELFKVLTGYYYKPREVRRIFLFIDLKSSTTYAEQLGHIKYSELIQDCFADLSDAIINNRASIFQYVGDEVVLTWNCADGLLDFNCIKTYFNFTDFINIKSEYYLSKYGFVPEFKAGANVGNVTIAEVGKLKKEIAFHGDAINTAARIQCKAGELGENFLISENLLKALKIKDEFKARQLGHLELKGKEELINIYSIGKNRKHFIICG